MSLALEELSELEKEWKQQKSTSTPIYRYLVGVRSWDLSYDASILVSSDVIASRTLKAILPEQEHLSYIELGSEVGVHEVGAPVQQFEAYLQSCRELIINSQVLEAHPKFGYDQATGARISAFYCDVIRGDANGCNDKCNPTFAVYFCPLDLRVANPGLDDCYTGNSAGFPEK